MNEQIRRPVLRALILIGTPKVAEKAAKILDESFIPIQYQMRGAGTASSEMMDLFGLGTISRTILITIIPKFSAEAILKKLEDELELGKKNTGIAFTAIINGISTPAMKILDESIRKELVKKMDSDIKQCMSGSTNSLIIAIVNHGFSDDVMEAARKVGARGGTLLHGRQVGAKEAMNFLGLTIQEEKEIILIMASNEAKMEIMKAIGEKCGMQSEARGLVLSSPIDTIVGV